MFEKYRELKPKDVSDEVWDIVLRCWDDGLSDREAALTVRRELNENILTADIHEWTAGNPEVEILREMLSSGVTIKAKRNVKKSISDGSVQSSKWWLERKAPNEFSTKATVAFEDAAIEVSVKDKTNAMEKFMEKFGE